MDHYSKCNICGDMVKNMRQHEKHKHKSNQKVSEAMLTYWQMQDPQINIKNKKYKKRDPHPSTTLIAGQMCHMQQLAEHQERGEN